MADDNTNPPELELPAFEMSLDDFMKNDEIEEAVIEEEKTPDPEDKPKRMTKEEMIALGLLPPDVAKKPVAEAVQKEVSNMKEIPVKEMMNKMQGAQQPQAVDQDALFKKATNRGSMALELVKVMVTGSQRGDVDDVVQYAFALADAIQVEVDRGYKQDLVDQAARAIKTS